MNNKIFVTLLFVITNGMLISCSTQKNTWATRNFHQTKTKYNIYYNGAISYQEGEDAIREANGDDFSTILNLYPVSNHKAAEASKSQMDRTIEKCRKCIKLHSIKARPKINYDKKRKDPKYAAWLEQEEFNNQLGNAWLLLGMAEFHKGDFLGSVSTFNYIAKHYSNDVDMVARCQLWIARAYAEMEWLYEAEDVLNKVQESHLTRKHAPLYSAVSADILLKTKRYKEAIPFLKIALLEESKKGNRPRFQYVLAQLYQQQGDQNLARAAYEKVLKMQPSNEMDFNARLRLAQLSKSYAEGIKQLTKLTKLDKNKDLLDQIYGTIGDIYLAQRDTVNALKNYELAIEQSTKSGLAKANVLVTAGDIYYEQCNYVKASPCYKEATQILPAEAEEYDRILHRSETLDELVVEYNMVQLQDSLQHLATLSEQEQRVVVDSIIARLIRAEKEEAERIAQAERDAANGNGGRSVNTANMLGGAGGNGGAWYFYNAQLMRSGKQSFQSKWGNRTLEDNWRRLSKATSSSLFDEDGEWDESLSNDSTNTGESELAASGPREMDNHKPEYYLQQIPKTEEDLAKSNELLARALYNMVYIYRDRVGDKTLSDETFHTFYKRFPEHELLLDLLYMQYLTALKENKNAEAEYYRQEIVQRFPNSKEADIVSQPDYFDRLNRMLQEQDSLYESTYRAYCNNDFATVKNNKRYAEDNYLLSDLMPRFLFLNAIAVAKTDGQPAFVIELQDMVARYPQSELATMAKDMLALMGQGATSQTGEVSSLQARRTEMTSDVEVQDSLMVQFDPERNAPAIVLMVIPYDEQSLNELLYDIALFNFSQFMIKDFDLTQIAQFTKDMSALQVAGFEKMDEAEWYGGLLKKNPELQEMFQEKKIEIISITENNLKLLGTQFSVQEYQEWIK